MERLTGGGEPVAAADLWGPVVVDAESVWYLGAEKGTNNTGELCGVIQALLWLLYVATGSEGAVVLCDSCYAMDMLDDRAVPKKNLSLIQRGRELLRRVGQQRTVTFVHVKGHSGDPGSDRADELVQWGKMESSEYARFREDGTGEGASRQGPVEEYEAVRDARIQAAAAQQAAETQARAVSRLETVDDEMLALANRSAGAEPMAMGRSQGGHDGSGDRLATEQQELAGDAFNEVDEEGFAVFDRSSFL
eukprot:SAG31_NODE_3451_length_4255_cov_5.771655_2_plen_249_part_00